jgi:hypothetical protein
MRVSEIHGCRRSCSTSGPPGFSRRRPPRRCDALGDGLTACPGGPAPRRFAPSVRDTACSARRGGLDANTATRCLPTPLIPRGGAAAPRRSGVEACVYFRLFWLPQGRSRCWQPLRRPKRTETPIGTPVGATIMCGRQAITARRGPATIACGRNHRSWGRAFSWGRRPRLGGPMRGAALGAAPYACATRSWRGRWRHHWRRRELRGERTRARARGRRGFPASQRAACDYGGEHRYYDDANGHGIFLGHYRDSDIAALAARSIARTASGCCRQ